MITLENVTFRIGNQTILDNVSLHVPKCNTMVVIGPSGAGKSTLLKVILGLLKPQSGKVWVDGQEVTQLREKQIIPIRRKIGIVFQGNALFDSLTVAENISYFLKENNSVDEETLDGVVQDMLQFFNLGDIGDLMPEELSGGMRKRVALARAIAFNPKIVLYDEPTTGLDPINAKTITDHIHKLKIEKCVTSVVVTHVLRDAFAVADGVAMIRNGKIVFNGSLDEIRSAEEAYIKEFLA